MQLNVEIPELDAKEIKKDAIEMGVPLNEYALQSFRRFLALKLGQRRLCFQERKKKILGRPIQVQPEQEAA
jgi:hypothetical protein